MYSRLRAIKQHHKKEFIQEIILIKGECKTNTYIKKFFLKTSFHSSDHKFKVGDIDIIYICSY